MADPTVRPPIPQRYVDAAARPEAVEEVRRRLPALLERLGERSRVVRLAREAYEYVRDPRVPRRYKILGLAALLYLLNPFDAIPDAIPGVGYVDDIAALALVVQTVRAAVAAVREAAHDVVEHAIDEAGEALATRGLAQLALSLWTATLAASIGLVYAGARAIVSGSATAPLLDPFAGGCLASAVVGLAATADTARRVHRAYRQLPPAQRDRLLAAIVSQATGWRIAALALPVLALAGLVVLRVALWTTAPGR